MAEWTSEELATLDRLWPDWSLSAAEIGRQFRPARSKNSVTRKAHRRGLDPRPSPIHEAAPRPVVVSNISADRRAYSTDPLPPENPISWRAIIVPSQL